LTLLACVSGWRFSKPSSPVLARRLQRSIGLGSLAGDIEGQKTYELDSHRLTEIGHLQEEMHNSVLLVRFEILLALGLFLP
jgi:hypothetical protein